MHSHRCGKYIGAHEKCAFIKTCRQHEYFSPFKYVEWQIIRFKTPVTPIKVNNHTYHCNQTASFNVY